MEKTVNKGKVKVGIYLCAILMMGAIAVSSNLANLIAAFPGGKSDIGYYIYDW